MDLRQILTKQYGFVGTDGSPGIEPILKTSKTPVNRTFPQEVDSKKHFTSDLTASLHADNKQLSDYDLFNSIHGLLDYGDLKEKRELSKLDRNQKISIVSRSLKQIDLLVVWLGSRADLNKEKLASFLVKRLENLMSCYPVGSKLKIIRDWGKYGLKNLEKFLQLDKRDEEGTNQYKIQLVQKNDYELLKVSKPELAQTISIKLSKHSQ